MQKKQWFRFLLMLSFAMVLMTGCQSEVKETTSQTTAGDEIKIHFIDVGQGDSILVQSAEETLLIDAGENDMGDRVVSYLNSLGITTLDYVIGTHPHSDHIGGLDVVINEFQVEKVILPMVEHSTKTYEDVLIAIQEKGLKITKPVVGTEYSVGDATFQIIAPSSEKYDDLNDYSVGVRLVYGKTSYVFVGDADKISEEEMCKSGLDLSADVLKLNHHGSSYSNNKEFIDAVSPTYAVISVGEGNSYGHPHKEVLEDMQKRGIDVYRTDLLGTIVITSDGENITIQGKTTTTDVTQQDTYVDATQQSSSKNDKEEMEIEEEVYVTASGNKYHKEGCSYLKGNYNAVPLEGAIEEGYTPCSRCFE